VEEWKSGKVEVLISCNQISEHGVESIPATEGELTHFLNADRQDIISNAFVIYATRLQLGKKLSLRSKALLTMK
jgi:hypothetical protein